MWYKININALNIETSTAKAVLVKMPNKSRYAGYKFWHPSKLVRENGGKGFHLTLSFTEEFSFKLIKYGNGKWNKNKIIKETEIDFEELMQEFETVDIAIKTSNEKHLKKEYEEQFIKKEITVHTPSKIDSSIEVQIDEELKR